MAHRKLPATKAFFPVIHVSSDEQMARRSVDIARKSGADGVFLISHSIGSRLLLSIYSRVRQDHPDWWIGINRLDVSPEVSLFTAPEDMSAVWTDGTVALRRYNEIRQIQAGRKSWDGLYFGGVAFKYRPHVEKDDFPFLSRAATEFTDVITTSGEKTGSPPAVEKIRIMREAIGEFPLAIASGITAKNVTQFIPYVDAFLVASSIIDSFYSLLDYEKTKKLAERIHAF